MFKKVGVVLCMMMLVTTSAFAHVMNEDNVFDDLSISEASKEIVLLAALGVISYQDAEITFRPLDPLTAKDLAAWVGSYYGLEGTTSLELAQAALADELITTIDGEATYALVNEAFFHGTLQLTNTDDTMTREQFAKFVASHVHTDIGGHTLMEMSGFTAGPTGVIEKVERVTKQTPTGENANIYQLTIDGDMYEMGMHPRTITDSVDPLVWRGLNVAESWYGPNVATDHTGIRMDHEGHEGHATEGQQAMSSGDEVAATALQFVVIGDTSLTPTIGEVATGKPSTNESGATDKVDEQLSGIGSQQEVATEASESSTNMWIWWVVIAVVFVAGLLAFFMRKRRK